MDSDAKQQAEFVGQITRHQAVLRAYIISLMPGMDGVSDVLQESNIILWEKRRNFQPGTNFQAWAFAIARYEVKSHRRKNFRPGVVSLDDDLLELLASHCEKTPEETDERLHALEACLGHLKAEERKLIEHRYFSGKSLDDFSSRSGRSPESLSVTLFRVRAALRKCINGRLALNTARP